VQLRGELGGSPDFFQGREKRGRGWILKGVGAFGKSRGPQEGLESIQGEGASGLDKTKYNVGQKKSGPPS